MPAFLSTRLFNVKFLIAALFLFMCSPSMAFEAAVSVSSKAILFTASDSGVKYISVNVVGPSGESVFAKTSISSINWTISSGVEDGHYKYEVTLSNVSAGSADRSKAPNASVKVSKQSGTVLIRSGAFVLPTFEEVGFSEQLQKAFLAVVNVVIPQAHADQLIADDLIVEGSVCTGFDCVNGEQFNRDTSRFKENNLRLHFQDTSVTSSFPSSDWRIVINDSSNGGANFFAIEDSDFGRRPFTIETGSPANSLFIDDDGRIGFGTSTPMTTLEAVNGNNPTLRLNQDGSQGFTPQSWDIGSNENSLFIRDFTNNSALPFQIQTGAPSNAFIVNSSGNVGLGIEAPTEKLHVMGNAIISGNLELGSSRSIKNQIKSLGLEQAMAAFSALQPVMFKYNHSPDEQSIGFIAEDVPELVATQSRKSLKPMDIVAVLTKVVQQQQKTINQLSQKIDHLSEQQDKASKSQ